MISRVDSSKTAHKIIKRSCGKNSHKYVRIFFKYEFVALSK